MPRPQLPLKKVDGFLPIGLELETLQTNCDKAGLSSDRVLLFFKHLINATKRYNERKVRVRTYVEMHVTHLEKIFGKGDVSAYKEFLLQHYYIETQGYSKDRGVATRYRVHQDMFIPKDLFKLGNPMDYYPIRITDRRAVNAEIGYLKFRTQEYISRMDAAYLPVIENLKTLKIDADTPEAKKIISQLRTIRYEDPFMFDEVLRSIQARDNEYYVVCRFGKRFHTVWSSVLKLLRPLIRFEGFEDKKLVGLDLVNSQPWLTTLINKETIARFVPEASEELAFVLDTPQDTVDWVDYKALCLEGGIYERWIDVLTRELGDDWRARIIELNKKYKHKKGENLASPAMSDRDVAKVLFFTVIFGKQLGAKLPSGKRKVLQKNFKVLKDAFRSEWPGVWEFFSRIKLEKLGCNPSDKKGGHSNLSMLMQRIESTIMKQFVVEFLGNGINKFVPIYDGTLHLEEDIDLAIEIAYEVIKGFGLPAPVVKMEDPEEKLKEALTKITNYYGK